MGGDEVIPVSHDNSPFKLYAVKGKPEKTQIKSAKYARKRKDVRFEPKYVGLSNKNEFVDYVSDKLMEPILWKGKKKVFKAGWHVWEL